MENCNDKKIVRTLLLSLAIIAIIILAAFLLICRHKETYDNLVLDATCTSDGQIDVVCVRCEDVLETKIIEAYGHYFEEYILEVEPSKDKDGLERRYCSKCDVTEERVYVCPHTTLNTLTIPSTCFDCGEHETFCSYCKTTIERQFIEMLECAYGEWGIIKEPTCTELGIKQRVCGGCGKAEEGSVDLIDHDYKYSHSYHDKDDGSVTYYYKCVCGKTIDETEGVYSGFAGVLSIDAVGLIVNTYNSGSQSVCDRKNSACYFSYRYLDRERNVMIIGDHWNQGFDKIKKCSVGMIATLGDETYRCVEIFTGHNCESYLSDDDYNDVTTHAGDLFMYTCNDNWRNVTIVAWEKI